MCELWHIRCTECTREYTDRKKLASCQSDDPADKCPPHLCMEIGTPRKPVKAECEDCKNLREMAESLAEGNNGTGADVGMGGGMHVGVSAHASEERQSDYGNPNRQIGGEHIAGLEGALPSAEGDLDYYRTLGLGLDEQAIKGFELEGERLGETVSRDHGNAHTDQSQVIAPDESTGFQLAIPGETHDTVGRVSVDHHASASFYQRGEGVDMEPQFTDEVIEKIRRGGYL